MAQEPEVAEKAKQDALVISSSESAHERLERTLADMWKEQEAIRNDQNLFRESLAAQQTATDYLTSLLHQVLEKVSSGNPSTSKD